MAVVEKYVSIAEEYDFGTEEAHEDDIAVPRVNPKEFTTWVDQDSIATSSIQNSAVGERGSNIDFDMYVNFVDGIGWILKWLLGDPTSLPSGTGGAYTHTYKCDDVLKSFTVLVGTEDLTEVPYPGQVIKSVEFVNTPGGYLMMKVFCYGVDADTANSIVSPSFSVIAPAMSSDLVFKVDTSDKSKYLGVSSITITNNIIEGAFTSGSTEIQNKPKHTKRRVECSLEFTTYDAAMRTAFLVGTPVELHWVWTGASLGGVNYALDIKLGEVNINDYDHAVVNRDVEVHKFAGFAEYDAADTEIIVVLTNSDDDYADASAP